MGKKTPIYNEHVKKGGKMVEYAGYDLAVEYEGGGLIKEHEAVRNAVGVFDVSHMGEIFVEGKDATPYTNTIFTNDVESLADGACIYGMFCMEDGGVVDDLLIYKYDANKYLYVVNGANVEKDWKWMNDNKGSFDVELRNDTEKYAELAIQGPKAQATVQKLVDFNLDDLKYYTHKEAKVAGMDMIISRTGYTGEDGFELYPNWEDGEKAYQEVMKAGEEFGIMPCGLGCRDTLRFEASLPLYGHELSEEVNPVQAGLKFFLKFDKKENWIGKDALKKVADEGPKTKIIGMELKGKGIAREGARIEKDGKDIGYVTTGYLSPTLGKTIANILIDTDQAVVGNQVEVVMRKKKVPAEIISKRFLPKK